MLVLTENSQNSLKICIKFKLSDLLSYTVFNPDKDFCRMLLECLGKEGKSISALARDLEKLGFKHHRLILTGYLRALTDMNIVRERSVPPSKVYQVIRTPSESIYETVGRVCQKKYPGNSDLIIFVLNQVFKRPVFQSELSLAGVNEHNGKTAPPHEITECRKLLKRSGNVVPTHDAYYSRSEYHKESKEIIAEIVVDATDSNHLVLLTKQTRLL